MNTVKEGTVVKVEKGRPARVHILFDGDAEPTVYQTSPAAQWIVGARVPIQIKITANPVANRKRGPSPILNEAAIRQAIKKLGKSATARAVAEELGVSERTLERWRAKQGFTWREVIGRAA
jgi:hypothetical protein